MNWKLPVPGLVLVVMVWLGYVIYAVVTASPTVHASWGYVDENTTELWVNAKLDKPLLVPVEVDNLSLSLAGIPVARVARFDYSATRPDISMAIAIDNRKLIRALVAYMNNGQRGELGIHLGGKFLWVIPVNLNQKEEVSEDILSHLNFTTESKELAGGLVKTPALVGTKFEWIGERNGEAVLIAHMKLYNPNGFPVPVGKVSFDAYANGVRIGQGKSLKTVVIPARGYATVNVETLIDENALPGVWEAHVKNGEISRLKVNLYLDITALGRDYHIKLISREETLETDIIGTINGMLENLSLG